MNAGLSLAEVVRDRVGGQLIGDEAVRVLGVKHDSRAVVPGDLFVAIAGHSQDGSAFVADAVARGAAAVIAETSLSTSVPVIVVDNARRALAFASAAVYHHPTFTLDVVGVTGTNGKSTVTALIHQALGHVNAIRSSLVGTVRLQGPGIDRASAFTTPEADDLTRFAQEVLERGASHLVMEVSSHALSLHRVDAVRFHVAAFTNLSQDHLDFHGSMDAYFQAKKRLFVDLGPGVSVINVDDAHGAELAEEVRGTCLRVSKRADVNADVFAQKWHTSRAGIEATFQTPRGVVHVSSPLFGEHNVENLGVAIGCAVGLEVDLDAFAQGLSVATGAQGRLTRVAHPEDVAVFVDYAHTPDALGRVMAALKPLTSGRLIVVFGCGGDRDRSKRSPMGREVGCAADLAIVTNDNPRTEDPASIAVEICRGLDASGARDYVVELDRRAAIALALKGARPGDTVLIAGKGHEDYQIIGTEKLSFDDSVEAARVIASMQARGGQA